MALQLRAPWDALLDAGASEAKVALAAEEPAGYENRFDAVEPRLDQVGRKVDGLRGEMNARFAEQGRRLARMDRMIRTLIVLVLGVLGQLLFIHSRGTA